MQTSVVSEGGGAALCMFQRQVCSDWFCAILFYLRIVTVQFLNPHRYLMLYYSLIYLFVFIYLFGIYFFSEYCSFFFTLYRLFRFYIFFFLLSLGLNARYIYVGRFFIFFIFSVFAFFEIYAKFYTTGNPRFTRVCFTQSKKYYN